MPQEAISFFFHMFAQWFTPDFRGWHGNFSKYRYVSAGRVLE